jgi:hypothetical protein
MFSSRRWKDKYRDDVLIRTVNQIDTERRGKSRVKIPELVPCTHQVVVFSLPKDSILRGILML